MLLRLLLSRICHNIHLYIYIYVPMGVECCGLRLRVTPLSKLITYMCIKHRKLYIVITYNNINVNININIHYDVL